MINFNKKLTNTKINFAKNWLTNIIIPAIVVIAAIVLSIFVGFNKGMDLNGGIIVSVVSENYDLTQSEQYNEFKGDLDQILLDNGMQGSIYLLEKDDATQDDILVVKIEYNTQSEDVNQKIDALSSDLKSEFYGSLTDSEIQLRNLIIVSTFGSNINVWNVLATILASLIALICVCVYVGFRSGMHSSVMAIMSAISANILTFAMFMLARVQIHNMTLAVIPFVTLISSMLVFSFIKNAKENLKNSEVFERKSNVFLANETIKQTLYKKMLLAVIALLSVALLALTNITNNVLDLGLAFIVAIVAVMYNYLFICPPVFALTHVRKIKKEKQIAKTQESKLDESTVLTETNLDELVKN